MHEGEHVDRDCDDLILMRYLGGDGTPEDAAGVDAWVAGDPARADLVARLRTAWNPAPPAEFDPDDAIRSRLRARLDNGAPRPLARPVLRGGAVRAGGRGRLARLAGLAAALVLMAAGATLLLRWPGLADRAQHPAEMRDVVTPRGQRAAFALGDGTRITLDADSRLSVRADRDVALVGRAYFQVTHDNARAFRVHTAQSTVEDLGTEFVVTAFPEERATQVVVASGSVAVSPAAAPTGHLPITRLTRGGMARLDSTGLARITDNVDVPRYLAWTEGRHVFKAIRLGDAIAELSRWYDVDIRAVEPRLLDRRFTATFDDQPLAEVLEVLSVALDLELERNGRIVVLRARTPEASRP